VGSVSEVRKWEVWLAANKTLKNKPAGFAKITCFFGCFAP
jgi:hypothetical protein